MILFVLAVAAIVLAVNVVMAMCWILLQGQPLAGTHSYPHGFFVTNTLITVVLICGGTLIEMFNLRGGGDTVARMAGGRLVMPNTGERHERRLLNIVEEMALASGVACPKTYLMEKEESINAFAAGYSPNEAVIVVTRGTLVRLTRDELQGVIAHEFSHILNGDMRLNIKLIGVLFGIEMLADFGLRVIDFAGYRYGEGIGERRLTIFHIGILAFGTTFFLIGYIGLFFGRLIKSAVSRQREFLADASAVQFTRNPDGLGCALRKIGGLARKGFAQSNIEHHSAERLSHLFLSAVRPGLMAGFFATHPPIRERLRRIYGRDIGMLDGPELVVAEPVERDRPDNRLPDIPFLAPGFVSGEAHMQAAAEAIAATAASAYGNTHETGNPLQKIRLAPEIDQAMHEPGGASAIVYALLLEGGRHQQLLSLREHAPAQSARAERLAQLICQLPSNARLPLLDLSMPALRQLSIADRAVLLKNVDRMIAADQRVTLYEFVLQTVLTRRLDARAGRATPFRFSALTELKAECAILFSLAAHVAAPLLQQSAVVLFMRAVRAYPQLGLAEQDLIGAQALGFAKVKLALDRANLLAPLATPMLIKSLVAIVDADRNMPLEIADLLRAICAAIDAPMPAKVAAIYTESGWPEAA